MVIRGSCFCGAVTYQVKGELHNALVEPTSLGDSEPRPRLSGRNKKAASRAAFLYLAERVGFEPTKGY